MTETLKEQVREQVERLVTVSDRGQHLAMVLQAMEDAEKDLAQYKAEHKSRMETLLRQKQRLQFEILTGQMSLIEEVPAAPSNGHSNGSKPAAEASQ